MSVESKIRELMQGKPAAAPEQLDEATLGAESIQKDQSIKAANEGDRASKPRQGSSADASFEERDEKEENQGAVASGSTPNSPRPQTSGPGNAPNFKTVADPTSVVNMPGSSGNVTTEEIDVDAQLTAILGESASEDFRVKTKSLFEAVVIARVNEELIKLQEALEAKAVQEITEAKEEMVSKVDSYLSYVVEQWISDNQLAVDTGLRTEIAEDFIGGLKTLFQEHYISIPEDKYDVVDEMANRTAELETRLNESINDNIEMSKAFIALQKNSIFEQVTKNLAATEVEKLKKLVEGVDYENDQSFNEKLVAIKETYYPTKPTKSVSSEQLTEDMSNSNNTSDEVTGVMSRYVDAISRSAKNR